jgi:replicative DNA helicase
MVAAQQELDRPLPNSEEAERAILGAILLNPCVLAQARTLLAPVHFYVPSHRRTFEGMIALADRSLSIDSILLHEQTGEPVSWLTNLTYGLPHSSDVGHYAAVVRGKYALRRILKLGAKIQAAALDQSEDPQTILEQAQQELFALSVQYHVDSKVKTYSEIASSVMSLFEAWADGKIAALPTQIPELDERLAYGGLSARQFVIIAARSSFGKTALALQIGLNVSRAGTSVLIASLEMPGEQLFLRNLASVTGVPHKRINPWTFQRDTKTAGRLVAGVSKLDMCPIQVEDRINDLGKLCSVAREWKRRSSSAGLMIVDYLQLVKNKQNGRSRQEEVAGISSEIKRLAGELDLPIIGVSQLSRRPAHEDRRPELSDLRESGQIEQDADIVLFPWSDKGLEDVEIRRMRLYCAKQRNGSVGWEIGIDFHGEEQWFYTEQMIRDKARLQN